MFIFIRYIKERTATFYINKENTVRELKGMIHSRTRTEINDMILIFGGRQLGDEKTLEEYKIEEGSSITLHYRLRGD